MADRPDAYVRKDPGDIIRSGDWNELQIRAREEIRGHRHTGKDDGALIPRTGIEPNAIDGSIIDPAADVTVKTLTTSGNLTVNGDLKVNGKEILGDIADLLATVKGLQSDKLNREGDTVTGTLNIQKNLNVLGALQVSGGIYNAQGSRIVQTDATDWLRINPDSKYPGIAMYKSVAIGEGGLAIGDWSQPSKGNLTVTGLITASSSDSSPAKDAYGVPVKTSGIRFLDNPGGGSYDAAWIQYYARSGEACTLEIGVSNNADDHIALMPSGNVGIGLLDPKAKLTVAGEFIRKVKMATGLGPEDGTDNGQIASRVLTFTKYHADTAIRIFYCDNLRVNGNDVAARWEIRVDSQSVPGGAIFQDKYGSSGNYHEPATIMGYAVGISAGTHTIGVWVGPIPPRIICDAHTGWNNSRWTLEVQEVWL